MQSTNSANLELIAEHTFTESGYIILIFVEMSLCELYLVGIKDIMGMVKYDWKQIIFTKDIIVYGVST